MTVVDIGSILVGVTGVAFAYKFYLELWKWARMCQRARIMVAYKGKVKLQAPITEWVLWVNSLDEDKDSHGRVIWSMGNASVAIGRSYKTSPKREVWQAVTKVVRRKKTAPPPQTAVKTGTWSARDETVK